jgi:hypothetical protein
LTHPSHGIHQEYYTSSTEEDEGDTGTENGGLEEMVLVEDRMDKSSGIETLIVDLALTLSFNNKQQTP